MIDYTSIPIILPLPLFLGLYTTYTKISPFFNTEKQRAYILSTISATTMSIISVPFVWTYIVYGLQEVLKAGGEGWMYVLGKVGVVFFATYLTSDLLVGYFKYRSQVGLLTGWVHHICYIALMIHLVNSSQSPIFLIAGIMEVPTLDLAVSNLFPSIRNDERFLVTFFLLRILFHAILLIDCARPSSRLITDDSWMPTILLALSGALHVSWFRGGLNGYLKRRATDKSKSKSKAKRLDEPLVDTAIAFDPTVLDSTLPLPGTPEDSPLVTPYTPSQTPMTLRDSYIFTNLPALPAIPAIISLPTIPPLSELTAAGFKDAVRNRWEEQRGRFTRGGALGGLGLRRRKGKDTETQVLVQEVEVDVEIEG
ncbi:hypothetical protein BCR39DRAFT_535393 [Naematelia encephala]|uniref:TLC domain-domain-containing protein n=1 Tax=Naematelia encephala TaxID=71784 RepID=A0A1Y2B2J2_9TREE|nr:hypothetical protein BCR39DRAFT_535393 [Naematelia encephala]